MRANGRVPNTNTTIAAMITKSQGPSTASITTKSLLLPGRVMGVGLQGRDRDSIVKTVTRRFQLLGGAALLFVAGGTAALALYFGGVFDGPKSLTREEYLSRITAICRPFEARLAKIPPPFAAGNPQALALSIGEVLPLLKQRLAAEGAVRPPRELAASVRKGLALADESIQALETTRRRALAGDLAGAARGFVRFLETRNQARSVADAIGITC